MHRTVLTTGGQHVSVGTEGCPRQRRVAVDDPPERVSRSRIEAPQHPVAPRCDEEAPIGAERDRTDCGAERRPERLARAAIPQLDLAVHIAGGQHPAVRAERHPVHRAGVTVERFADGIAGAPDPTTAPCRRTAAGGQQAARPG